MSTARNTADGQPGETRYDLVVIGSGPAGEKGAAQAAYFGKRVAMVEKEPVLGGTANTTALPAQALRETALYLSGFRQRNLYGVNISLKDRVTPRDFLTRERLVKQGERTRIAENLKRHKVDLFRGEASLADARRVSVKPKNSAPFELQAEAILIATGSTPLHAPVFPFQDLRIYDADTILNIHDLPPMMLVVGGGVVGCEYASIFAALGIRVIVIEERERILGFMDAEITGAFAKHAAGMGLEIITSDTVAAVKPGELLEATLKSGRKLSAHALLVATGRAGNTQGLGLEKLGIQLTPGGHIVVDDHYQTAAPGVYAAGDVIGFPAMASTSMEQARVAMVHAFDLKYKTQLAPVLPYSVYSIPECAMAGETEESLQRRNIPYVVGRARYDENARGQIIGERLGFLKLIFARSDMRLLGAHIFGEQAGELIHLGVQAMLMSAGADVFIQTCFNYPTLGELYKYATYDALGRQARPA